MAIIVIENFAHEIWGNPTAALGKHVRRSGSNDP